MSEAVEGPRAGAWARRWGRGIAETVEPPWPALGTEVGGFLLEARLGTGSFGTVYRARRGGRLYALKFLYLPRTREWAWRELQVLLRLRRVGWVAVEGYGLWPDARPRFLFLALPFVRGVRLFDWARRENPTAREVVERMLPLTRQVGAAHQAGVVHRDIKGENVLVQEDGQPVLLDFGVGTYPDALEVTHPLMPPGTALYRSPEIIRFRREKAGEERYQSTPGDDLWALGVVLYWLLTGAYPFNGTEEGEVAEAILKSVPVAPHERNPRVPRSVSEVCLRMLEKAREARYPDAQEVCTALEEALSRADAAWEEPLAEAWGPDAAATPVQEDLGLDEELARLERVVDYERKHFRRGEPMASEESATPCPPTRAGLPSESKPPAAPEPPRKQGPGSLGVWAVGVLGVLALMALLAVLLLLSSLRPTREVMSPPVREVAPRWCPLEGEGSAAPSWPHTPAPVANATYSKDTRMKTPRKDLAQIKEKRSPDQTGSMSGKTSKALLLCTIASGCVSPAAQVRTQPKAEECPAGAQEAMTRLGIHEWDDITAEFLGWVPSEDYFPIHEGPGTRIRLDEDVGTLKAGTLLIGYFIFGPERVFGRFTEAHTPDRKTWPVCLEVWDYGSDEGRGLVPMTGSIPGTPRVNAFPQLKAVKRFE